MVPLNASNHKPAAKQMALKIKNLNKKNEKQNSPLFLKKKITIIFRWTLAYPFCFVVSKRIWILDLYILIGIYR